MEKTIKDEIKFIVGEITLVFYKKEYDHRYSFLIEGNYDLTSKILKKCKTKRVHKYDIYLAKIGIFKKINELQKE